MCTVTVQDGLPGGGFGPAVVHTYMSAEKGGPFCPNIGSAIKLGKEKLPDLATGFSFGFEDIVVLHKFKPSAVFTGVEQPDFMPGLDAGDVQRHRGRHAGARWDQCLPDRDQSAVRAR
jgi:hypothetical protein